MTHTLKHLLTATLLFWAGVHQSQAHDILPDPGSASQQESQQEDQQEVLNPQEDFWNAIVADDDDLVGALLDAYPDAIDIEGVNNEGITALVYAAEHELYHVASELIGHGANVEGGVANGGAGWTPLQWAARNDDGFLIELLTQPQHGANLNAITTLTLDDGVTFRATALMIAAAYGSEGAMMSLLLGVQGNANALTQTALRLAVEGGFVDTINQLLPEGEEGLEYIEGGVAFGGNGLTLLQLAIMNRDTETAQLLIERGANVNALTYVQGQNNDVVMITPMRILDIMEPHAHTQALRQLLVNAGATTTTNPLHLAAINGEIDAIDGLLEQGANVNEAHLGTGNTALHYAAQALQTGVLGLLADIDEINLNAQNARGETALHILIENAAETEPIHNLLGQGANPSVVDQQGCNPLDLAIHLRDINSISILIYWGARTDAIFEGGNTHLHMLLNSNYNGGIFQALLRGGNHPEVNNANAINPNEQNDAGDTALHIAVRTRNISAIQLLLEAGADGFLENNAGVTPRAIAETEEDMDAVLAVFTPQVDELEVDDEVVALSDESGGSPDSMSTEDGQTDETFEIIYVTDDAPTTFNSFGDDDDDDSNGGFGGFSSSGTFGGSAFGGSITGISGGFF